MTNDTLTQLRTLADTHEFNLAYNTSDPIRAIAGSTLSSQILTALNTTLTSPSHTPKLTLQLGAYASFQSFFALTNLTNLPNTSDNFHGIPDYASAMVFELVTNSSAIGTGNWPTPEETSVRFLFHNGTASNPSAPVAYPLFGQPSTLLSWNDFSAGMTKFAIGSQSAWCAACGNTTGVCASSTTIAPSSGAQNKPGGGKAGGLSKAVAGVIGAMVTLAVVLGVEGLIMFVGGYRLASKKRLAAQAGDEGVVGKSA